MIHNAFNYSDRRVLANVKIRNIHTNNYTLNYYFVLQTKWVHAIHFGIMDRDPGPSRLVEMERANSKKS